MAFLHAAGRYSAAILFLASALMQFIGLGLVYNLDKKTLNKMNQELAVRRTATEGENSANG